MSATYTLRYAHTAARPTTTKHATTGRHPALMLSAGPLVGLAFVIALPFAGIALLAWMAMKAVAAHRARIAAVVKRTALFFAAPFIGLAYLMAFPFVAIGMLVYHSVRGAAK